MNIEAIMTKHVVTVGMDDTLETIRDIFEKYKFHHLIVLENCRVMGVITDRDLLMHMSPFVGKPTERALDAASLKKHAHQVMTRHVCTVNPHTSAGDAALLMLNNNVSCLPVLDSAGACVGIVSWKDLLRWSLEHLTDNACPAKMRSRAA